MRAAVARRRSELLGGLLFGVVFGFLLQKGGVTDYDVIIGQLMLVDFTVLKVMLTAVGVGTLGVHLMEARGMVTVKPKAGAWGKNAVGGLIFGAGFALLGYCPGTVAGAVGEGRLDALLGGLPGILFGSWLFAVVYPRMARRVLTMGSFRQRLLHRALGVNVWAVVLPGVAIIGLLLLLLERAGL